MASVGNELLNAPFPEMVYKLASAIAEGQYKLDMVSCQIAALMGDKDKSKISLPLYTSLTASTNLETSMIGAGFQPTFYQFIESIIEVKMAITMSKETDTSVGFSASGGCRLFSASVNASYSSKYSYKVEGSSLLRTKIVPVPPNQFLTKYLEKQSEIQQKIIDAEIAKIYPETSNAEPPK